MSNLEQVQTIVSKKDESTSLSISDIIDAEKSCYLKRVINVFTSFNHRWNQHRATIILFFPLIWDKWNWKMPCLSQNWKFRTVF